MDRAPTDRRTHLVGLLLGTENDWPVAFESLVRALGPIPDSRGVVHEIRPSARPSSRSTCATSRGRSS